MSYISPKSSIDESKVSLRLSGLGFQSFTLSIFGNSKTFQHFFFEFPISAAQPDRPVFKAVHH